MQFWKVDTRAWTVRAVEGERFPGIDSDGETCYDNTHYRREDDAWRKLSDEVAAFVSLSGRSVINAQAELDRARIEAANAAAAFVTVQDQVRQRGQARATAGDPA